MKETNEKEALTLTRNDYWGGLEKVDASGDKEKPYLAGFSIAFPEGINTASMLEICRLINEPSFETRVHITRICIAGKTVEVTCPNGDLEKFHMTNVNDSFDAFPLFQKEPFALVAISDAIYGYLLKKSIRLSAPDGEAATQTH